MNHMCLYHATQSDGRGSPHYRYTYQPWFVKMFLPMNLMIKVIFYRLHLKQRDCKRHFFMKFNALFNQAEWHVQSMYCNLELKIMQ